MFLALSDVIDAFVVAGKHGKKRKKLFFYLNYFFNFSKQKQQFLTCQKHQQCPIIVIVYV